MINFSRLKICSPKICPTWPTTLRGLAHMEVTSLLCKWVCSLQPLPHMGLPTWEKESQRTHIWCSQSQLLAWTSPLCWMDVCPLWLFWLPGEVKRVTGGKRPWSRQISRMPTRSRVPKKLGLMMTSLEQRIRARAKTTRSLISTWNLCCQWLLLSQLWLVACQATNHSWACACSWCRSRCYNHRKRCKQPQLR